MGTIRKRLVNFLSGTLGSLLIYLRPQKTLAMQSMGITIINDQETYSIWDRLMRKAIINKAQKNGNHEVLAQIHKNYWTNKGADFFETNDNRLQNENLPFCLFMFDLLAQELNQQHQVYDTLVEFGTGDGHVLDYLSQHFNQITQFIGIDLSETQITRNQQRYKHNHKLSFKTADAVDWVRKSGKDNTIFITFMGVLEYLTENQLTTLTQNIHALGRVMFIAIEPQIEQQDFTKNPASQVYGYEGSFSHNYLKIFKDAGFTIWYTSGKKHKGLAQHFVFIGAKTTP